MSNKIGLHEGPRTRLIAYGIGILAAAIALFVRWHLDPVLGERALYSTFLPAVLIAAYIGGFWPGLLVTILCAATANYFIVEPHFAFAVEGPGDAVALTLFGLTGTFISGLCESLHRAQRRIAEDERRRAEEAVRQTEERFRRLIQNSSDIISFFNADGTILYQSPSIERLLGHRPDDRIGKNVFRDPIVHPDDLPTKRAFFEKILSRSGSPITAEFRLRHADGTWRDIEAIGQNLLDEPSVGGIVANYRDITERKRAEDALRESEHRWRNLAEALPQLVWTCSPDGSCDYCSTQWGEYTGLSEIDLLGSRWLDVVHPDDRESTQQAWKAAVEGGGSYDVEFRIRRSDGVHRWFKTRGVPIRDGDGHIFKWLGTCTDVTASKQLEEELRHSKDVAESANRAKDEFLANVSHEIRTPMNAILGMTELTLDTPLTDDQRQCLRTVKSAADNLLGIINDLLDFSKIEAGKLTLDPADFSLRAMVGDTLRALATRAHKKNLELICHIQPEVPDDLVGDAGRLRQVLLNLVGNAIKFTEHGDVVVEARMVDGGSQKNNVEHKPEPACSNPQPTVCTLQFSVHDTGVGIPPEKQERIFRAFEQEDSSTTRKYGGTGLGLTIASQLVALMDGRISVESQPGQGSTFSFTARLARQPHPSRSPARRPPFLLSNLRVLIVDDNETNRRLVEEWLRAWRLEPAAVSDGLTALDTLWHAAASGRPYQLVLLDARMPDTDGLALAAKIRERNELSATRIMLLTSGDRPADLARSRELRIDAHLLKPIQQEELIDAIYRVMSWEDRQPIRSEEMQSVTASSSTSSSTPVAAVAPQLNILMAEDNEFNLQLMEQLLVRQGHHVRAASNGRQALDLLGVTSSRAAEARHQEPMASSLAPDSSPLTTHFDLLLLDIHMPELDGFQVIRLIREQEQAVGGHLPVIALTARSRQEDRERCLAAGMDDFLAKPVRSGELHAAIERLMNAVPRSGRREPSLLDPHALLAACGGDGNILSNICQAFQARLPEQLKVVQDALHDEDAPRLREAAHKLHGMTTAFSTVAGEVISQLEDEAAAGRIGNCRPLAEQFAAIAHQLIQHVNGMSMYTLHQLDDGFKRGSRAEKDNR